MSPTHLEAGTVGAWIAAVLGPLFALALVDIGSDGLLRRLAGYVLRSTAAAGRVRLGRSRRRLFGRREPADLSVVTGTTAALRQLVKDRNEELWAKVLAGDTAGLVTSLQLYRAENADYRPEVVATVLGVPVFDLDFAYARRYAIDVRFLLATRAMWHGPGPDAAEVAAPIVVDAAPAPGPALPPTTRLIDL